MNRPPFQLITILLLSTCVRSADAQQSPRQFYLQLTDARHLEEVVARPDGQPTDWQSRFNPTVVELGAALFQENCLQCHDAEEATDKRKTFDDWMKTIGEMAAQDDADIPRGSFIPIATYLTSLGPPSDDAGEMGQPSDSNDDEEAASNDESESDSNSDSEQDRPRFDPQVVARGQFAFQSSCTKCHDAQRSLSKRKSLSGWLATVRRMSRMDDADVANSDIRPIATYLASQPAGGGGMGEAGGNDQEADLGDGGIVSDLNISGTVSTLWRGGNDNLENPGFFADVWVTMDWQPEGPLRGRVTTCTSCHSEANSSSGFTLELVDAYASFDLLHGFREKDPRPDECKCQVEAEVKAGRFVVPFGAFHAMSHPGTYRTVTNPLMYNMGRQVNADRSRVPVLPMPYSDEGVDLHAVIPLRRDWKISLDGYAVNGLQGAGGGINYNRSRSYADNNRHAGYGGRATISNKHTKIGGSVMAGRMEDDGAGALNYHLAGGDATTRMCDDNVRLYFEYAMRRNDTLFGQRQISYGIVSEIEAFLLERPNLSALVRYDTLEHRDATGHASIERFTWGVSTNIKGTTLILNHERWNFPVDNLRNVDVLGLRWVATF